MSDLLRECWPVLAAQLEEALRAADESALADDVGKLRLVQPCTCGEGNCQSFYTAPPSDGSYGTGYRNVLLDAPWPGEFLLDVVDGKIVFVEILDRPPLD
jgi:hypothetical protein